MATVEHSGIVKRVSSDSVDVEICRSSACGACEANGFCGVDRREQIITVKNHAVCVVPGDAVIITAKASAGTKALCLGYIFPLLVFLIITAIVFILTKNEGIAGGVGFIGLGGYYFSLLAFKKHIQNTFVFHLKKAI